MGISYNVNRLHSRALGRHKGRVVRENLVQAVTKGAVLECKAPCERIELLLGLAPEVLRVLLQEELGHEETPRETVDAVVELPHRVGVHELVLGLDLLLDVVVQGLVDVPDAGVVGAPGVDGHPMLLLEEVLEEGHVGRVELEVNHALEADVLVQPDRPAEAILNEGSVSYESEQHIATGHTLL
jgi:hypothetical protein